MNLLAQLLGLQGPGVNTTPSPVAPAQAPMGPEETDITIAGRTPSTQSGILKGGFQVGRTGGNILGILGDALLAQAGQRPMYAPRLENQRRAEALEGFTDDPLNAFRKLAQVDQQMALKGYGDYMDNQRQAATEERLTRAADEAYTGAVTDRVTRMLAMANPQNYGAIKDRINSYVGARGVKLPFDLPDQFDPSTIQGLRLQGVSTDKQIDDERAFESMERVDADRDANRAATTEHRNAQRSSTNAYRNARLKQLDATLSERERHNRAIEANRGRRGGGGGKPAKSKYIEGKEYRGMENGREVRAIWRNGKMERIN